MVDVVFLAGLLLSVRVMVSGVELRRGPEARVVRSRWAMLAGALTLSGFLGAISVRLSSSAALLGALVVGGVAIGALSAQQLVSRLAALPVGDHEIDPRFELQGVPALVVDAIPANGDGFVQLADGWDAPAPIRARSIDGAAIARGEEVGVERIDGGVAFVEVWSAIEARL
jgi:hypothetical protein